MEETELRIDKAINESIEFGGSFKRYLLDNDKEYRDKLFADFKRRAKAHNKTVEKRSIKRGALCRRQILIRPAQDSKR